MASQLQHRRGTNTETTAFTGAEGEITVNTTNKSAHVHDGLTSGGHELARSDLNNVTDATFAAKANSAGVGSGGGGSSTASISNITQANPGVVTTTTSHGFSDGDQVTFTDIVGMTELNGNAYFCDVLSGTTFAIYANETLTTTLNTISYSVYSSSGTATASEPLGAPGSASYVVVGANDTLQNERILQAGTGLTLTDAGAGGGVSFAANLATTVPANLGGAAVGISNTMARSDHIHAIPTANDVGAVVNTRNIVAGTGLSGGGQLNADVTLNLNASIDNISNVTIGTLSNGDTLIYNSATSKFENAQSGAKLTVEKQDLTIGAETAITNLNFEGVAISDGAVIVTAEPGNNSKVNVTIPRIHTQEQIEDIVGGMVSINTESGLSVTYNDTNGKLDFNVDDFTITLTGDVQGSATVTDLANVSISTTMASNSTILGTNTQGNYVATLASGTGLSLVNGSATTEGSQYTVSLNTSDTDYIESIQDIVGTMVSPTNTENGINVTYDDTVGKLGFDVNDFTITLGGDLTGNVTITDLANATLSAQIGTDAVALGTNTTGDYVATLTAGTGTSITNAQGSTTEGSQYTVSLNTSDTDYIESIQDIVGTMVSPTNTENGINVTYDDTVGKLGFDVNDFTITLGGDLTGNVTITDLANATLSAQIGTDAVALGTNTTGDYVATLTAGTGTSITNAQGSTTEGSNYTINLDTSDDSFVEDIQDLVGTMVTSNTETGLSVVYDDLNGKLNFSTNNFVIALGGDVSGTATVTNLGNTTITTQIANDAVALGTNTTGQYASTLAVSGNGLTCTTASADDSTAYTITSNATSANTANTIVSRDAGGNFIAGTVTADLVGSASLNVLKSGDTMTGTLTLSGDPTSNLHAATKAYVDNNSSSSLDTEAVEDIVGAMVSNNTETGLSATYDDINGKLNFNVNDPSITLTGDVTGSAIMTNLGNVSIGCTVDAAPSAHTHATTDITNFAEEVEDLVGDMVSVNTESGITVTYVDNAASGRGKLNFDVNDPTITLTGDVTGSATMTNLGNVSIATTVGNDSHTHTSYVAKSGDTMTGALTLSAEPTANLHAATKAYVDNNSSSIGNYVQNLVAGTGVSISNNTGAGSTPTISIGQAVETNSNVTFNDITVSGSLTVSGTTTTINAETIDLADNMITLNSNLSASTAPTEDAGIEINRGNQPNKTLLWDESNDQWTFGTETVVASTFSGTALYAQYADIAENYSSDKQYTPGTVVVLGGIYEVTECTEYASRKVAGVVSTDPALLMNKDIIEPHVAVALMGRVPCQIIGTVEKGDLLVTSERAGFAEAWKDADIDPRAGSIIGKALENKYIESEGVIEIIVGLK